MKQNNLKITITKQDIEYWESVPNQYLNPPCTMEYKKFKTVVGMGTSDDYELFREGDSLYLFTYNDCLNYYGLEIYNLKLELLCDAFFQGTEELPSNFEELCSINQAKILNDYIY